MKPCDCNKPTCRLCWLAANDPRYRKLWSKPSFAKKAANLATDAAKFIIAGAPLANKEIRQQRLAICENCPEKLGGTCSACGCSLKIAVWAATKDCPLGKWPTAETKLTSQPVTQLPDDQSQ